MTFAWAGCPAPVWVMPSSRRIPDVAGDWPRGDFPGKHGIRGIESNHDNQGSLGFPRSPSAETLVGLYAKCTLLSSDFSQNWNVSTNVNISRFTTVQLRHFCVNAFKVIYSSPPPNAGVRFLKNTAGW
jgi:hypothetical protein